MPESSSSTSESRPKPKRPRSSAPPPPNSSGSSWKQSVPLPAETRAVVLEVLAEAERQLNQELQAGWYAARANPDAFKARRLGVEEYRLRVTALLTRSP